MRRLLAPFLLLAACAAGHSSEDGSNPAEQPSAPEVSPSHPSPSPPAAAASSIDPRAQTPPPNPAAAPWRKQVLYLLLLDRFRNGRAANDTQGTGGASCFAANDPQRYHGGDIEGLRQNLGYLKELGATAIWTTPLYEQIPEMLPNGRCGYHGYWANFDVPPNDVTAVEPKLGTQAELSLLVTDLHAKEMRLVMDMVVNHTGDTASLPKTHPDWFHDPATCHSLGNPTVTCPLDHHPDFAEEKPEVAAYLTDVAKQWTQKYGIDAIRMDTAKHVSPSYFEKSFLPGVKSVAKVPHLFTIAEVFDEGSLAQAKTYLDTGFDSTFHFPLRRAFVEVIAKNGSTDAIANAVQDGIAKVGAARALDLVLFIDNHDVPRFANEPGFGVDEADIQRRLLLALDLMFTLPGIPQLYYGDELGMYGGKDPDNRRDLPEWAMNSAGRNVAHQGSVAAVPAKTFERVKKLASMRKSIDALSDGKYRELWRQNGSGRPNVFAFARGEGPGARVIVINNAPSNTGTMRIPIASSIFSANADLSDELGDGAPTTTTLDGGQLVIDLPPRSAGIYRAGP